MSPAERSSVHEETWLVLPWLANGRLSGAQRDRAEDHVRLCSLCANELALQRRLCDALSAPERVTYAPGPSFRKLLERLDDQTPRGEVARGGEPARSEAGARARGRGRFRAGSATLWRPPGFAWAASFIIMVALTGLATTAYRWSEARYVTRTDASETHHPDVLHIAFDRELTIGEVEELLKADGARVVEGPDTTGIFGIAPVRRAGERSADVSPQILQLAARLRADPRVRWVEPIDTDDIGSPSRGP